MTKGRRPVRGKMLWFNEVDDVGSIETDDGQRVHVHRSGFAGEAPVGRCAGLDVMFELETAEGRLAAVDVVVVAEASQARARMRRTGMRAR